MSEFCRNCGMEKRRPRWCADCWRMFWKTLGLQVAAAAAAWVVAQWVALFRAVTGR